MNIFKRGFVWLIGLVVFVTTCYGQVSFISNGQNITSDNSWDIRLIDLNGDSFPDAFFENKVWLNDGKGNFTKSGIYIGTGLFPSFADLNGDGFIDVLNKDSIFLNDGTFHFSFSKKPVSDIAMYKSVPADVDNDGDIDIVSCSATTDRILLNDGKSNFTNTGKSLGGWGQASYAFGDMNGDGFTDIYVAIPHIPPNGGHTPNLIWLGDGAGNSTQKTHDIPGAESRGVILADFDGDGDLDLYVSDAPSCGMIFINDGKGNFTDSGQKLGGLVGAVKAADFNNDGYLDLFICHGDGNGVTGNGAPSTVWLGDGHGHFTDSKVRLQSGNSNSIAVDVGDINGDGKIDAVVAHVKLDAQNGYVRISCPVEIWLNNTLSTAQTPFVCNFLNEPKPGKTPVIFGKGIVSVEGKNTHACTFSPDGKMLIFSRYPDRKSYIMTFSNGQWSSPAEAFFEGKETSFSADGKKVFYYTNGGDIYYNEKTENGWGNAINVSTINTSETEYYPSVTADGTLFFSRNGKWTEGRIMYSTYSNGKYNPPVDISLPVNTGGALHAYIAPDKSYMIFNSPRVGSYTKLDLWISFHNEDGSWTNPQNLGKAINSGADAILCPTVTPDGNYLFFTRLNFNTNTGFVYWVSTNIIEAARSGVKQ